ncbi:hypothetical protein PHSY_002281 [Pseudozyma hubeiensis SY62]|uniref:Autophagy-related protein 14 n=1 Tax=Pseudozyma hubeiensis (strain SY62) TaxID=1305764 RepID=R9P0H9_PSEHS|nr:hypothetical protein PHSY_002281 [Pseudozyma hubeiensis SY62]GAC94708.1 hypothetical protein PHSY_002281 [Pseudozyma hubeiensis SY62]
MTSTSTQKPARPSQPPSRHSIGASSQSKLKATSAAQTRLGSRAQPPPARAKLKHAATAPVVPALAAPTASSPAHPHACQHCNQMDTRFYCDPCLASRIEAHHSEMRRLSLTRDKAKASVETSLFDRNTTQIKAGIPASSSKPSPSSTPIHTISEESLPDPFDNPAEPSSHRQQQHHHLALHSLVQSRAKRSAIIERVQNIHRCISESQLAHLQGQEVLKEKTAHIALRKQNLAKAWSALEGSSAAAPTSAAQRSRMAAKSRWLAHPAADHIDVPLVYTDVYTHYERQPDESSDAAQLSASDAIDHQLGAVLTRARLDLAALQSEAATVSAQLAVTRAALARQAFALYSVTPPTTPASTLASLRARHVDLSASNTVAQRISRLSERYMPGAFGLGHGSASTSPVHVGEMYRDPTLDARNARPSTSKVSAAVPPSDWSIVSLPLPLPVEARRYQREVVNGAVTYAANLLQLIAAYLGISLPFSIEQHKGRLAIRPNPLWDGGGGSSAKTLHLSSSAYTHLTASLSTAPRSSKLNHLAESTYGLGASTLSTIESYIHLSSGTSLPWGLSSAAAQSDKLEADADRADAETRQDRRSEADARTSSKSKPDQAAKSFVSALVMLCYNAAYLATKQGIQLDLVSAAANPLDLLSKAMQRAELGRLAHANHIRASSIQDLSLPGLDYEQLAQILEPNNAAADSYKRGSSKPVKPVKFDLTKPAASPRSSTKHGKTTKMLEQSYVDVGEAAASVLDIKDPSSRAQQPSSHQAASKDQTAKIARPSTATTSRAAVRPDAVSSLQKQRVRVDQRGPSAVTAQPPPSLEFLRQRGRDASKAKRHPTDAKDANQAPASESVPAKVGPGAVIFNGVEVGVGNLASTDSQRGESGKKSRTQAADEGWSLV